MNLTGPKRKISQHRAIARLYVHWLAQHRGTQELCEVLSLANIRMVAELDLLAEYDREIDSRDRRHQMLEAWATRRPSGSRLQ
jgi:hypothetical protein